MRLFRRLSLALAITAPLAAVAIVPGCGVEPVGLDACRRIESARCEEAPSCPDLAVKDVDACKRYYRDQCLHGLAISEAPGTPTVDRCINAIHAAGGCARSGTAACNVAASVPNQTGCGIVEHPETATDCAFLTPPATPPATTTDAGTDSPDDAATD